MPKIYRVSRRMSVLLALTLLLLSLTPAAAQQQGSFYYANGERIPIQISSDYVAARFAPGGAAAGLQSAAQSFSLSLNMTQASQPGSIAGQDFYLIPISSEMTGAQTLSLVNSMRTSSRLSLSWVNPVYQWQDKTLVLTDEFIAGFPAGTSQQAVDAYNASNGVVTMRELSPDVYVLQVVNPNLVDALAMANRYETGGVAAYGEPNWSLLMPRQEEQIDAEPLAAPPASAGAIEQPQTDATLFFTPNDPYLNNGWHLYNYGQFSGATSGADIKAKLAWDTTQGSSSVSIAVLDDGVQTNHPDLDAKIVLPFDAIGGDNDPSPYDNSITRTFDAHGTHVAGLIAAETNNGVGIAGVCPNCSIMPIRIFYTYFDSGSGTYKLYGTIAGTTSGIDYARTNGAAVISVSWGDSPSTSITTSFRNAALNGRGGLGTVVVMSVGNSYKSAVSYPAFIASAIPGMIGVAASTFCDTIKVDSLHTTDAADCSGEDWWGNNWGTEVGLTAPSHKLPSTDLTGADGYVNLPSPDGDYSYFNGTSGSTPIVSGVAALVISLNPTFTSDQVRDRLLTTTDPIYTSGYDTASGWGRVNAQNAVNNTTTNTGTPHDHRSGLTPVTVLPYSTTQSIIGAFDDHTDPALTCLTSTQTISASLWYSFTPAYNMVVIANTFGSNYDTVLGVYDSAMTSLACNDNTTYLSVPVAQSQVGFNASFGSTYYILIGSFTNSASPVGPGSGANLTLNLSTTTPPPTTFTIAGHVTLQRSTTPPNPNWAVPVHVIVKPTAGGAAVYDNTLNLDNSGYFNIDNLPADSYNVWIKNAHTLANMTSINLIANSSLDLGTLREGDADDGNSVVIGDFAILAAAFGTTPGSPMYDARADFNNDSAVTILDFSLLAANFGIAGAAMP